MEPRIRKRDEEKKKKMGGGGINMTPNWQKNYWKARLGMLSRIKKSLPSYRGGAISVLGECSLAEERRPPCRTAGASCQTTPTFFFNHCIPAHVSNKKKKTPAYTPGTPTHTSTTRKIHIRLAGTQEPLRPSRASKPTKGERRVLLQAERKIQSNAKVLKEM